MMLDEDATEEDRQALIKRLKLDGPLHEQFQVFIIDAIQGDLGDSIRYKRPAVELFFQRFPNTLLMVPPAMICGAADGGSSRNSYRLSIAAV